MISVNIPFFSYKEKVILNQINSDFEEGKTHGIVGLNGSGKTTFFHLIAGYLQREECKVSRDDRPLSKRITGFLETEMYFYPNLTGEEFLSVFKIASPAYNEQRLAELFKIPLGELIEEYSTGTKKKLLLLSLIRQGKDIYILDEPFNGLDLETNRILQVIIEILNSRGKTIFVSSHILEPLLNICSDIHQIKENTLYRSYSKPEFFQIEDELFGEYTRQLREELPTIL
jgi:ABC-2 type transport system ATP-binding protein